MPRFGLPERRLKLEGGLPRRRDASGQQPSILSRSCRAPRTFTGSLRPRATSTKCNTGSARAKRLEMSPSTNCTCWDWSAITTCGCADTLGRAMAGRGVRPWAATISYLIGKPIRTCMKMEFLLSSSAPSWTPARLPMICGVGFAQMALGYRGTGQSARVWNRSDFFLW